MNSREGKDGIAFGIMEIFSWLCILILVLMAVGMFLKSAPILQQVSLKEALFSSVWNPMKGRFGFLPFITGTLWVTGIAFVIAFPVSLLTSVYLSEFATKRVREIAKPLIDLLASIPSVIFGVWGILVLVPLVKDYLAPMFGVISSGYTVLTAGVVLAIMIFPVIIHVELAVFLAVPRELREASWSLGANRWQTVKHVVIRRAMPGIIAASVLGFARAFGETMAVLMVAGNIPVIPTSCLDPGYPLPALIANNYGEMMSIPSYDSALMLAAFLLFIVVVVFSVLSRLVLKKVEKGVR